VGGLNDKAQFFEFKAISRRTYSPPSIGSEIEIGTGIDRIHDRVAFFVEFEEEEFRFKANVESGEARIFHLGDGLL
jgi:hypothetical protein